MVIMIPVQAKIFGIIGKRRKKQMALSDKRVKLTNETLSGIKIAKLNGWERALQRIINNVRKDELAIARNLSFLNALVSSLITTLPTIVAVTAFSLCKCRLWSGELGAAWRYALRAAPAILLFSLPPPPQKTHPHPFRFWRHAQDDDGFHNLSGPDALQPGRKRSAAVLKRSRSI